MSKAPAAIKLYKGLSLYRVERSSKWYVRVWDKKTKKYLVKSAGEDTVIRAREVAKELSLLKSEKPVEREYTFGHFALKLLHRSRLQHQNGERSQGYIQALHSAVQNEDWGLLRFFGERDVRL
jgi:hypothetical protein